MSTALEIETSIQSHSPTDRKNVACNLAASVPDLDGDEAWKRISEDPTPSSGLAGFADAVDSGHQRHGSAFPEIEGGDFEAKP